MNWDALGAFGEIAGATGVILTLAYLARQIQESNRTARLAATQEVQNQGADWIYHVNSTPEWVDLWVRGNLEEESLTLNELIQYRGAIAQLVNIWERAYSLRKEGRMDDSYWEALVLSRKNLLASPGIRSYWQDREDHYSADFRGVINGEILEANDNWSPLGVDLEKFATKAESPD